MTYFHSLPKKTFVLCILFLCVFFDPEIVLSQASISVVPDSFSVALAEGDSVTMMLKVSNAGSKALSFSATTTYVTEQISPWQQWSSGTLSQTVAFSPTHEIRTFPQQGNVTFDGFRQQIYKDLPHQSLLTATKNTILEGDTIRIFVVRSFGTAYSTSSWDYLNSNFSAFGSRPIYIDYTTLNVSPITSSMLHDTHANVLFISDAWNPSQAYGTFSDTEIDAIRDYVNEGHGLIITSGTLNTALQPEQNKLAPLVGLDSSTFYRWNNGSTFTGTPVSNLLPTNHPVFGSLPSPYPINSGGSVAVSSGWSSALKGGTRIADSTPHDSAIVVTFQNRIYCSLVMEGSSNQNDLRFLYNEMIWTGSTPPWLSLVPDSGTVAPGTFIDLAAKVKTTNLLTGDYKARITFLTNDPAHNPLTVPVSLQVTGRPLLTTDRDSLDFSGTLVGFDKTDTLSITNNGSDVLTVDSIISNNPIFSVNPKNFTLSGHNTQLVFVKFTPPDSGTFTGSLSINSNDTSHPVVVLPINGRAAYPPLITVSPDSFAVSIPEGDSTSQIMMIGNAGTGDLHWSIAGTSTESAKFLSYHKMQIYHLASPKSTITGNPDGIVSSGKTISSITKVNVRQHELTAGLYDLHGVHILFDFAHNNNSDTSIFSILLNDLVARGGTVNVNTLPFSLSSLSAYNVVIITESVGNYSAGELADLQTWVQNGGGLLVEGDSFAGNFADLTIPYGIHYTGVNGTAGYTTKIYSHPVTIGCDTIFLSGPVNSLTTTPAAEIIVNDIANSGHSAVSTYGSGRVVVVSDDDFYGTVIFGGDNRLFGNNAIDWLAGGGGGWLSVNPTSGTVTPAGTEDATVKFNAANIFAGDYATSIGIINDDPVHNPKRIPARLHVIGHPHIVPVPDTIDFGPRFVNYNSIDTLIIKNTGSLKLDISSVTSNNPLFLPNLTFFSVPPHNQQLVLVRFSPHDTGSFNGEISISSNDSGNLTLIIPMKAMSVYPPAISIVPDSLALTLTEHDSTTRIITISNTGLGELRWKIKTNGAAELQPKLKPVSQLQRRSEKDQTAITSLHRENMHFNSGIGRTAPYSWQQLLRLTGSKKILAWVGYTDLSSGGEFENTINAIYQYFPNFTVDTTSTTSVTSFATMLGNKDVFLVPEQELISDLTSLGISFSTVLTSFVQNGKTIIVLDYGGSGFLGATTFLNGTGLLDISNAVPGSYYNAVVNDTASPLVKNVPSSFPALNGVNYHHSSNGHNIVRELVTGNNIVSALGVGAGEVVYIGMDFYSYNNEMARLLSNAVQFGPSGNFLSVTPDSGTVTSGSSKDVTVNFNSNTVSAGDYHSQIVVTSNDPLHNPILLPVHLRVTGRPYIVVTPDSLHFGSGFIGFNTTDTLTISNTGSEALEVSNIFSDNPAFNVNMTNFTVATYSQQKVLVTFTPIDTLNFTGTLTIASNDSSHLTKYIPLTGIGAYPPEIQTTPDSLWFTIHENDSTTSVINVSNIGHSILQFLIDVDYEATKTSRTDDHRPERNLSNKVGPDKIAWDSPARQLREEVTILRPGTLDKATALPLISHDSIGDGSRGVDISEIRGDVWGNVVTLQFVNASSINPSNWGGYVGLDVDQNPLTGIPLPVALPTQDVGCEYYLSLFQLASSHVVLYDSNGTYINTLTAFIDSTSFTFSIPLTMLGNDDGSMNIAAVVGDLSGPIDWIPDIGHGTVEENWLTVSPMGGSVASGDTAKIQVSVTSHKPGVRTMTAHLLVRSNDPGMKVVSIPVRVDVVTGIRETPNNIPVEFSLKQNFPNPFNPTTTIKYGIPVASQVTVAIYNILGETIEIFAEGQQSPGWHQLVWNAERIPSGIYFYRLHAISNSRNTGMYIETKKMLLLK